MNRLLFALLVSALVLGLAAPAQAQAQAQAQAPKIGVFDITRTIEETEEGKRIQARLDAFRNQKQAEVTAKEGELAELQNQLNSQALSLSAQKRADLEKQIQRKMLEVNQLREAASGEMQLEYSEAQDRFQQQLLAVVQQFGRDEGFTLILERSQLVYADSAIDVTTALVDQFNRIFKGEPPAAAGQGN